MSHQQPGIQEGTQIGDSLYWDGEKWVFQAAGPTGQVRRSLGPGSIPEWGDIGGGVGKRYFAYSYTASTGAPYIQSTSTSYETVGTMVWPGTDNIDPLSQAIAAAYAGGGTHMDIRIYDETNLAVVAEKLTIVDTAIAAQDLGTISNLSTGPSVWSVQIRGAGGGPKARISAMSGRF